MLQSNPFTRREITASRVVVDGREWDLTVRSQLEWLAASIGLAWAGSLTDGQLREAIWQTLLNRRPR